MFAVYNYYSHDHDTRAVDALKKLFEIIITYMN